MTENSIVTSPVRDLICKIEDGSGDTDLHIRHLITALKQNCSSPGVKARYTHYRTIEGTLGTYPTDSQDFAASYDPLTQEDEFMETWSRYGIVIGKDIISRNSCDTAIGSMQRIIRELSNDRCDLLKPATYDNIPKDDSGTPILSRGFFELYHDNSMASIRQSPRLYLHHVLIWGRTDLWSSFDRLGLKLPNHQESYALPLHVDQNPNVHPEFKTVQGVLALADCPRERGTYVGVPGSRAHFRAYAAMAKNNGEYVELDMTQPIAHTLEQHAQPLPLRAGNIVTWDSRTTHSNSANRSEDPRFVMYQAAGPAQGDEEARARADAFLSGIGSNNRAALMHASRKPRYSDYPALERVREREKLTLLGELQYGLRRYEEI